MTTATVLPPVKIGTQWYKPFTPEESDVNALFYPPTPDPEPTPVVVVEPKRPGLIRRAWNWTKKAAKSVGGLIGIGAVVGVVLAVAASIATAVTTVAVAVWNWAAPPVAGAAVWLWAGALRVPAALRWLVVLPVRGFWFVFALGIVAKWAFDSWRASRRAKKLADVYDHPTPSPKKETEPEKEPEEEPVLGTVVETPPSRVMVSWTKTDSKGKAIPQKMTVRTLDDIGKGTLDFPKFTMRTLLNVVDEQELIDTLLDPVKSAALVDHIHANLSQLTEQRTAFYSVMQFMRSGDFAPAAINEWFGRMDCLSMFNSGREKFFAPEQTQQKWIQTRIQHWAKRKKENSTEWAWFRQDSFGRGFKEEYEHLASIYADPRHDVPVS